MIGSYRLVEPLGSGGMSSVFRAVHKETGHEVAVKVLPRYLAKNPTLLQRFLREAKSAESLEDPNIVAIYDRGSEAGRDYLVLEYVPGGDLHDLVREGGPMAIREAVDAIRQVAEGLRHAAGRGLIHRDIKPANILRTPEGGSRSPTWAWRCTSRTRTSGSPATAPPSAPSITWPPSRRGTAARPACKSDIYSLGCTFYLPPDRRPAVPRRGRRREAARTRPSPRPTSRKARPEVPERSSPGLIQKMMAKRAENRFADYDQLLDALDAVPRRSTHPAGAARPAGRSWR